MRPHVDQYVVNRMDWEPIRIAWQMTFGQSPQAFMLNQWQAQIKGEMLGHRRQQVHRLENHPVRLQRSRKESWSERHLPTLRKALRIQPRPMEWEEVALADLVIDLEATRAFPECPDHLQTRLGQPYYWINSVKAGGNYV